MRLKKHREDVGWLRSHGILSMEKQEEIAARYQRLILAFECGKPTTKLKHIERVLRDAE